VVPVIDAELAGRLIAAQFPQWAHLPLRKVEPGGADHVIFRLGDSMSVRLPRAEWAAGEAEKEHKWLPQIAPHLPLAIPVPLGVGTPAFGYPWPWCVSRWLEGETPTAGSLADLERTAVELAGFLTALQQLAVPDTLTSGSPGELTHGSLLSRDRATRAAIAAVEGTFDAGALLAVWEAALQAPAWGRPPVWFHGDMHPGNLLAVGGRVSAVIDFGGLGVGDPACDLVIGWTLLTDQTRPVFRAALGCDDATWVRGRGWALTTGLNAYTAYAATNPHVAENTGHQLTQVLAGP
jgi:aminoglycoside phosphotransferase (APT) family kinase protein